MGKRLQSLFQGLNKSCEYKLERIQLYETKEPKEINNGIHWQQQ